MTDQPELRPRQTVSLKASVYAILEEIAGTEHRTLSGEIEHLVKNRKNYLRGRRDVTHAEHFTQGWTARWESTHGVTPPMIDKKDTLLVCQIVKSLDDDPARIDSLLDAYFACDEKFFQGHPVSKLRTQLPRFMASMASGGRPTHRAGEYKE